MRVRMYDLNILSWMVIFLLILCPSNVSSAPYEVTLFPDSAMISETTKVSLQMEGQDRWKALFVLPAAANPETLATWLPEGSKLNIEDQTWRQIVRHDDAKISELKKRIEKLKADRRIFQSNIQSINTQIQFWQLQTKAKSKTLTDASNMSVAIGKNTKKLFYDKMNEEIELERLDKQLKELQDELERISGNKETAWEVTAILAGTRTSETMLSYSYFLSGCGWISMYRLEARPAEKKVFFSWDAEIWQSSGQDWNRISTKLATLKRPHTMAPSDLPPWIIRPLPDLQKKSKRVKDAQDQAESLAMFESAPAAPQELKQTTYSVWQLGKKNLPAGVRQRVRLQDISWPSEFVYLMRPSLSAHAFVKASSRLSEPKEIPINTATFMIDGAILGKRNFSLAGSEVDIFFGQDPMVTAERTLLSKKSGEKGILIDRQTYSWDWRIDVKNSRDDAVRLIIEEPNPQARDERIKLTLHHDPEPSEKTPSVLTWKIDMEAKQKKSIFSSVKLEAPANMNLDLGLQ